MVRFLDIPEDTVAFLRRRIEDMYARASGEPLGTGSLVLGKNTSTADSPISGSPTSGSPISGRTIAENIAFGAAVAGAEHIEMVEQAPWWFLASTTNWMAASETHAEAHELFERIVPFPEQGPTCHHAEVYVTAFATEAYYVINDRITWIRATASERARRQASTEADLPHTGITPGWCTTVLAFRI